MKFRLLTATIALLSSTAIVHADPFPLSDPPGVLPPEAPFLLSDGLTATFLTDRDTLSALGGFPTTFGNWDMSAFNNSSTKIIIPSEVSDGAGVFRFDPKSGEFKVLLEGVAGNPRQDDPDAWVLESDNMARLDPATWTPFNTVLTGEESDGGRLFEIMNPNGNGHIRVEWRDRIPAVSHEGLRFDQDNNLYFVDEDNSGSVYKYVPARGNSLRVGQSFVLVVGSYANGDGDPSLNWNAGDNATSVRTGPATWVPITDENGKKLDGVADPFVYVTDDGGRNAADDVGGTPYGRPEDMAFKTLASGNQALLFSATSENAIYGVELLGDGTAYVRVFAQAGVTEDLSTGVAVAAGGGVDFSSPDNVEVGADGTVYIVEDQPFGDIWKTVDADNDGVAEAMGRWLSIGTNGAEPTGLEQDPHDPNRFIVNIQHPSTGNDALWEIRIDE